MNHPSSSNAISLRKIRRLRNHHLSPESPLNHQSPSSEEPLYPKGYEIRIICIYPSVDAGKLGKKWIEMAFREMAPFSSTSVEYFNFAVLNHDGICWEHIVERIMPDIILMVSDGNHMLSSGLRHSLSELLSFQNGRRKPMVIFRDLEPLPTLNTRTILDYVSVLSDRNHCEFNAVNGDGDSISCFRHPRLLLKGRKRAE